MSLQQINYKQIRGATVNASTYGMLPSASAATNKAALLEAVVELGANGGTIIIPRGNYNIVGDIAFTATQREICIQGDAPSQAYDASYSATNLTFVSGTSGFDLTTYDVNGGSGITIKDLTIYGTGVDYGIRANGRVYLRDLNVSGCKSTGAGIYLETLINMSELTRVSVTSNLGTGLLIGKSTGSSNTIFSINNLISRSNIVGIEIIDAAHFTFQDCVIESNYEEGLKLNVATTTQNSYGAFNTVWFENNNINLVNGGYQMTATSPSLGVQVGPSNYTFDNCIFNAVGAQQAVHLIALYLGTFTNCQFTGNIVLEVNAIGTGIIDRNGGTLIDSGSRTYTMATKTSGYSGPSYSSLLSDTLIASDTFHLQGIISGITAYAGGGITNATQLADGYTVFNITTCATAGDSIKLPLPYLSSFATGQVIWIRNSGAAACNVFVEPNNQINYLGTGNSVSIPAGTSTMFVAVNFTEGVGGIWLSLKGG